jgi:hypothetical protein
MNGGDANRKARRICVPLDPSDVIELEKRARRDRLPMSTALLIAARDGFGRPVPQRRPSDSWDESYDHSLQHELIVLTLMATEQVLKLLESITPYGKGADQFLVPAAQAAQKRIARGIPDALGGGADGQR